MNETVVIEAATNPKNVTKSINATLENIVMICCSLLSDRYFTPLYKYYLFQQNLLRS
ncbi:MULTISPECIES: hypothetical protein [Calothrix]|uniref:Uncharacterized protein n=2 Tax=Calothrix TaxID=1186 RepID=A0ABR8A8T2_9CYAN|nr:MULTISPECIES: hypothetical protein [Calothrix]MBD2196239.1 hypothetical protein [Calothrix parietina FACHB-288]MBD2224892.1 hypothetical protein [Calothrix anomala FACHB-343]